MNKFAHTIDTVLIFVILALAIVTGFCIGIIYTQELAAKAGAGHYTVNPTNGITQFQFKKQ